MPRYNLLTRLTEFIFPTSIVNKPGKIYNRPWGSYKTLMLASNYQIKIITIKPTGRLSLQKHKYRAEHWVVIKGQPTITVNDTTKSYLVNEHVFIDREAVHRLENFTQEEAAIIEVQIGDYLGEDDIIRIEDIYHRDSKK